LKKKNNALCTVKPTSTDNERAFSAGIGIFGFFFYCMALFLVGGDFFDMNIIRKTTEIKVFVSKLIKLSMKFGAL
jgi:hypothetical protein